MANPPIRFDDGQAYERFMGVWSQSVGEQFLDWLAPPTGQAWLDVGCGNGAFTARIIDRTAPAAVIGVDPSEAQLAFARSRFPATVATFRQGDAQALPVDPASVDIAVMPLVIFFVPDPAAAVAEMARVVRAGGIVTSYGWDLRGGGFPYAAFHAGLKDLGVSVPEPPSPEASGREALEAFWSAAGLVELEGKTFTVSRTWASFDDYWTTALIGPSISQTLLTMTSSEVAVLRTRMRESLAADASGRIQVSARANAIRGRVAS